MENRKRLQGVICVFIATTIWGAGAVWIRFFPTIDSTSLVFIRSAIGALFFLVFSLFQFRTFISSIKKGDKRSVIINAILGISGVTMYTLAIKTGSIASAAFLFYTIPLFVITLHNFFTSKKPITTWVVLALTFSAIGIFSIFLGNFGTTISAGNVWGLLAGVFWGLQILASRSLSDSYPTPMGLALMQILSTILLIPFTNFHAITSSSNQFSLLLYAIFASVIAPLGFYYGIRFVNTTDAGIIALFDPIIAAIAALLIVGEMPSFGVVIGAIFIIVGNILQIFSPEAQIPEILNLKQSLKDLYMAPYKQGNIAIDQLKAEQTIGFKMLFLYYQQVEKVFGKEKAQELLQNMAIERRKTWFTKAMTEFPRPDNMTIQEYIVQLVSKYWQDVTPYDLLPDLQIVRDGNKVTITHNSWSPIREAAETMDLDVNALDDIISTYPDHWMANELLPGTNIHDEMVDQVTGHFIIEFPS